MSRSRSAASAAVLPSSIATVIVIKALRIRERTAALLVGRGGQGSGEVRQFTRHEPALLASPLLTRL